MIAETIETTETTEQPFRLGWTCHHCNERIPRATAEKIALHELGCELAGIAKERNRAQANLHAFTRSLEQMVDLASWLRSFDHLEPEECGQLAAELNTMLRTGEYPDRHRLATYELQLWCYRQRRDGKPVFPFRRDNRLTSMAAKVDDVA